MYIHTHTYLCVCVVEIPLRVYEGSIRRLQGFRMA